MDLVFRVRNHNLSTAVHLTAYSVGVLDGHFGNATAFPNITELMNVMLIADFPASNTVLLKRHKLQARHIDLKPRAHALGVSPSHLDPRSSHNGLERRLPPPSGWYAFFNLLDTSLSAAVCRACGTIVEAVPYLPQAVQCLFGECSLPKRAEGVQASFIQDTKLNVSFPANSLVYTNSGTRVQCIRCDISVSSLRLEGKLTIFPGNGTASETSVVVTQ
jgi:hypothetical protein